MPKRYSPEIRRTALELVNQGQTCQASFKLTPENELTPTNATH